MVIDDCKQTFIRRVTNKSCVALEFVMSTPGLHFTLTTAYTVWRTSVYSICDPEDMKLQGQKNCRLIT